MYYICVLIFFNYSIIKMYPTSKLQLIRQLNIYYKLLEKSPDNKMIKALIEFSTFEVKNILGLPQHYNFIFEGKDKQGNQAVIKELNKLDKYIEKHGKNSRTN